VKRRDARGPHSETFHLLLFTNDEDGLFERPAGKFPVIEAIGRVGFNTPSAPHTDFLAQLTPAENWIPPVASRLLAACAIPGTPLAD
jgi:hypothetical protein